MTKRELIHFLEPFDDDIKIVVEQVSGGLQSCSPTYQFRTWVYRTSAGELLEEGEGVVILRNV